MRDIKRTGVGAVVLATALAIWPVSASADGLREGLRHLQQAQAALDRAWDDKGGHKKKAKDRISEAIDAVRAEMGHDHDRRHDGDHRGDRDGDHRRDDDHRRGDDYRRGDDHHRDGDQRWIDDQGRADHPGEDQRRGNKNKKKKGTDQ